MMTIGIHADFAARASAKSIGTLPITTARKGTLIHIAEVLERFIMLVAV